MNRVDLGIEASGVRRQASANLQFAICNLRFAMSCFAVVTLTSIAFGADTAENPSDQRQIQREKFLEQMRGLARATEVSYQQRGEPPQRLESPVFRYDDQPRRFLDATMWVWIDGGRPVAFQKIEAMPQQWQFCFTSVADGLLSVKWDNGHEYRSTAPGVNFLPLAGAPAVPERKTARKLAARELIRDFSARIAPDGNNNSQEMRMLPTPIYEYGDGQSNAVCGAVFGLTTNGTNPDVLVVLEARPEQGQSALRWYHAAARMTIGGVKLKYRETMVAEFEYVEPRPAAFPTWTFFSTPRNVFDELDDTPARSKTLEVAK
jgi:hypothetical protein